MQMLSDILHALGVDFTVWIQLGCFIVCYIALSQLIFKPYMRAFNERENRTLGNEETALRIIEEAQVLQKEYERKARLVNNQMKEFFDKEREAALAQYEKIVSSARENAASILASNRSKISSEIQQAKKTLLSEVPGLSSAIATKLAGKDIK